MATPMALEADREEQLERFYTEAEEAVAWYVERGFTFTMDDVRRRMKTDPPHENHWGTVTRSKAFRSMAEDSGMVKKSTRRAANKRRMVVWQPIRKQK